MEEEKKEKGFVVKDRRMFSEEGDNRDENREAPAADDANGATSAKTDTIEEAREDTSDAEDFGYPEINFSNFIISLSTSAMFHFGDFADPATGKAEVNLEAAKQTIDIISMLEEKTRKNLDAEEMRLVQNLLFELRIRYVKEKAKAGK